MADHYRQTVEPLGYKAFLVAVDREACAFYKEELDKILPAEYSEVVFTGNKYEDKKYEWHTGYPGGLKTRSPRQIIEGKFPERVVVKAVERMLARGPLQRRLMTNLKVYAGPNHPHEAQQPTKLDIAALNRKNKRD